ncbi:MAG: ATP-binding cassette domain-containing protein [Candidatus Omnitrophota bacterium]
MVGLINVTNICKNYDGKTILKNIDLLANQGECIAITGLNGSGKTTLLKAILKIIDIDSGTIEVSPENNMSFAFDDTLLYEEFTVKKNLKIYSALSCIPRSRRKKEIRRCLDFFGLLIMRNKKVKKLSAGMKKRLVLAVAELKSPNILLLDEPFNELDSEYCDKLKDLIKEKIKYGGLVLLTTHQKQMIEDIANRWIHIQNGQLCE